MSRRPLLLWLPCVALLLLLTACQSGPRKRVFPPSASVQELTVADDGRWTLALRLQNFSNVPQRFASLSASLRVNGEAAGTVQATPDIEVGPESVEVVTLSLAPSPAAAAAVRTALETRRNVRYAIDGEIVSSEPDRRRDAFDFESQLTPVPGLDRVLR